MEQLCLQITRCILPFIMHALKLEKERERESDRQTDRQTESNREGDKRKRTEHNIEE